MSLRNVSIYITSRTLKRLGLVLKLYPQNSEGAAVNMASRDMTRDELADAMINATIDRLYPAVLELEKELARTEKEFLSEFLDKTQKNT